MLKKHLPAFLFVAILMITGCAGQTMTTRAPETGDKSIAGTNLREVVNSRVKVAYLDPTVDFKRYSKVLLAPLNFDRMEIIQPDTDFNTIRNKKFELTDKDKEQIDKLFHNAMVKTLQKKGGFEIVENAGANVLTLAVEVLQIQPNAPKDDFNSRRPRVKYYSEGAGAMTIGAVVADSVSDKQIAIIADVKDSSHIWGENNRISNIADISQMFSSWGRQFNSALKALQE